jgi:acyl-coenzyme A synthetase/AMP-(fatty) acid ligase
MKIYDMDRAVYQDIKKIDNPITKVQQLSNALYCYEHNIFSIIYDKTQPSLKSYVQSLDDTVLKQDGMQYLFFTSGTTGTPTGVYKTKENLEKESQALLSILPNQDFKRVIVTVPFVHIYGIDIGAILPKNLDVEIWTKENFIPEELITEAQKKGTLVVTTPIFIKALNRINNNITFEDALFLTSTAPLSKEDAKLFHNKYKSSVIQLFASTETGLMAYKTDDEEILKTFHGVHISASENMLRISSAFVTSKVISNGLKDVTLPFQTEDIVNILDEHTFELLGRSSNIAKIAGKRISTQQIEEILEGLSTVECVLIKIRRDDKALKDEILDIYVESKEPLTSQILKSSLVKHLGSISIPFKIYNNQKILKSSLGKKIGFKDYKL